ncbi:hypothetical protein V7166_21710 [Bacillus thuringiensis]
MELTLIIKGKEKTFKQPAYLPALYFKESLVLVTKLEKEFSVDLLDTAVELIATKLYNNNFTAEEFWMGVDAGDVTEAIMNCLASTAKRVTSKLEVVKN